MIVMFLLDLIIFFAKNAVKKMIVTFISHRTRKENKKNCVYLRQHRNDLEESIKKIGNWIINFAKSADDNSKKELLSKLTPSLAAYWCNSKNMTMQTTMPLFN